MTRKSLLLLAIIYLAFISRFYKLGRLPSGLYWDEVSIGYNAYSILQTAKDEYGKVLPLWFEAFGEYKLPAYIYLSTLPLKLFGVNNFAVRFVSALTSTLSPIFFFFAVKEILLKLTKLNPHKIMRIALLSAFLLATLPWHIHFGRAAFEATLALFFVICGTWLWFLHLRIKKTYLFILSLGTFLASLYTYNAERIFTPLFLLLLMVMSWHYLELRMTKRLGFYLFVLLLLFLPFVLFATSNAGLTRGLSESFTTEIVIPHGGSFLDTSRLYIDAWSKNFASYLSVDFLFFKGDLAGRHSVREMGELYLWQLLLLPVGAAVLLRRHKALSFFMFLWLILSVIPASISKPSPHALRGLLMVFPLTFILAYALDFLSSQPRQRMFIPLWTVLASYGLFFYLHLYYIHYVKRSAFDWQDGYEQMATIVKNHQEEVDHIFITKTYGFPHLYTLFYLQYDPNKFQQTHDSQNNFGKFQFITSQYPGRPPPNSLYVAAPWESPVGKKIADISMINGDIVFRIWKN